LAELINLFPFYLFKHKVSNSRELKQHFLSIITELAEKEEKSLSPPSDWLCPELITSYGNRRLNGDIFSKSDLLSVCFEEVFTSIIGDRNARWTVKNAWFNYYTKNDYQEWHDHVREEEPCNLSFVYFLSFDPAYHGSLMFKDPSCLVRKQAVDDKICGYQHTFSPEVSEGDILVFPYYLEHCVKPFTQDSENPVPRITISGNAKIKYFD
jgi:hypothetical protein